MTTPIDDVQRAWFADPDPDHFAWTTAGPYFARTEADLLEPCRAAERLLEVGCAEGGNLLHLRARAARRFGIDRSPRKVAFAARRQPDLRLAVADAHRLPFKAGAFDAVLVRDVLHHVVERRQVLAEAWRVLAPGGALVVVEPNALNPLMAALALGVRAERGILASTAARLRGELLALPGCEQVALDVAQPLPLARALLHPALGLGDLGARSSVARALGLADRLAARVVPRTLWAYLRARALRAR